MRVSARAWVATLLLCLPGLAGAHGLLMNAESLGDRLVGTVYYSNGDLAVGESVELRDLTAGNPEPQLTRTDQDGAFSFTVTPGHRYQLASWGDEGHGVQVEITAQDDARPELVGDDEDASPGMGLPPAWAVIALILLASVIPIWVSRRRRGTP